MSGEVTGAGRRRGARRVHGGPACAVRQGPGAGHPADDAAEAEEELRKPVGFSVVDPGGNWIRIFPAGGDGARADAVLAELLALPLTDAEREQLTDLLPGGDARGLGTEH